MSEALRPGPFLHADWLAPPGIHAFTTLRHGAGASQAPFDTFNLGSRCGDEVMVVAENRRQLEAALALPSPPRWLRQVHGMAVAVEPGDDEPEADAAVTATPGTVLAILTADCLPVVLAAKDGGEIAAAGADLIHILRIPFEAGQGHSAIQENRVLLAIRARGGL